MKMREANGNATLTEEEVRHIRYLLDTKQVSAAELARSYLVSAETIRRIGRRETWGWIGGKVEAKPDDEIALAAQASFQKLLKMNPELAAQVEQQAKSAGSAAERMNAAITAERAREGLGDQMLDELKGESNGRPAKAG